MEDQVRSLEICKEQRLRRIIDSRYILLSRRGELFYKRGVHTGTIRVKSPGTPVQVLPENMPILVVFDWMPNLVALKRRIQKAGQQLKNDSAKDPDAQGFFVIEGSHAEAAKAKIVECFSQLPTNCLGVALLSSPSYVIPRSDVSSDVTKIMAIAETPEP